MHMVVPTLCLSSALGWSVLLSCFSGWTQRAKEVHSEMQISALPERSTTVLDAGASTRPALDMPEGKHLSSYRRRKKNLVASGRALLIVLMNKNKHDSEVI